ncbi:MAG: hypothetical protein AB1757_05470 [Acidobacteriota bacterium]
MLRRCRQRFNVSFIKTLLCGLLSLAFLSAVANARAATPTETLVFASNRPTNWDIYLFDKAGAAPKRLTDDPALDYNAVFSPDGRWVVFCSERRGNPDLFVLDLQTGGAPRLLVGTEALEDAPTISPDGKWLAYVSTRDGNANIYLLPFRPESSAPTAQAINLTRNRAGNFNPSFSPDGKRIAFASDRDEYTKASFVGRSPGSEIYVMNLDGNNQTRLTNAKGWDGSPVWSRDGETLYFYCERENDLRIWHMNADGTNAAPISPKGVKALSPVELAQGRVAYAAKLNDRWQLVSSDINGGNPRLESDTANEYWAPDFNLKAGKLVCHGSGIVEKTAMIPTPIGEFPMRVAGKNESKSLSDRLIKLIPLRGATFASFDPQGEQMVAGFGQIFKVEFDRNRVQPLYQSLKEPGWATTWSKDGEWIAFTTGQPFGGSLAICDIRKMRTDGSELVNLTADSKANNALPDVSPDSRHIVFRSNRDGNQEIYLMDADGKNLRRLTNHPATDTMPNFSPDGKQIAFASTRDDDYELYTLDISEDGTPGALRRLTDSPRRDTHPRYSPDGKWLVFASERNGFTDEMPLVNEVIFNPQPFGEIYVMRLADGKVLRLTHNKWEDGLAIWRPLKKANIEAARLK